VTSRQYFIVLLELQSWRLNGLLVQTKRFGLVQGASANRTQTMPLPTKKPRPKTSALKIIKIILLILFSSSNRLFATEGHSPGQKCEHSNSSGRDVPQSPYLSSFFHASYPPTLEYGYRSTLVLPCLSKTCPFMQTYP